jgi:hypothetical protein
VTDDAVRVIDAEPITAIAWAPFGWLPRPDTDPADGHDTLHFEWADAHLNTIEHTTDEIDVTERGLRCAVMYRHATHTQVLTPLDAVSVVAVAPAGTTVVLHRGTWHWGPFPIRGAASVRLLNVQGRRYAEDNADVDISARTGHTVEVVIP